jgi:hypothetical protein
MLVIAALNAVNLGCKSFLNVARLRTWPLLINLVNIKAQRRKKQTKKKKVSQASDAKKNQWFQLDYVKKKKKKSDCNTFLSFMPLSSNEYSSQYLIYFDTLVRTPPSSPIG